MESLTIVGEHLVVRKVASLAERLARTGHPVLIGGESGTGRHLVARVLHSRGPRAGAPFVAVDCRLVARGEASQRCVQPVDAVESARGGTLFLKDIEWIDEAGQEQILAALAARRRSEVRLVMSYATTPGRERALFPDVARRLGVLELFLPPLRERRCDIPALLEHFIAPRRAMLPGTRVEDAAMLALWRYDWPGNVRQLRDEVERAFARCPGRVLHRECLSASVLRGEGSVSGGSEAKRPRGAPLRHFAPEWDVLRAG